MKLDGIHHITGITGDAQQNVRFYAGLLGLRLVKKSVNQDDPTVYHLFYADDKGSPGSDITFFEYRGAAPGRAGDGMVHRVVWRVASEGALGFWSDRLSQAGTPTERGDGSLLFRDPEGLGLELRVVDSDEPELVAHHPSIPPEMALLGFEGVRAYSSDPARSTTMLKETLGFEGSEGEWKVAGDTRSSFYVYDQAPPQRGLSGGGTIHHVAWSSPMSEHEEWRRRLERAGAGVTPVIDRFYFRSIYFREPSGVLFEIATIGPGFSVDEPKESLGQELALPPNFKHLRDKLEDILTPLPDPWAEAAAR